MKFGIIIALLSSIIFIGCAPVQHYTSIPTAIVGPTGPQGNPGVNGVDSSCSVTQVSPSECSPNGGALITCGDNSQALVLNGTNGVDGQPGTSGTLVTPVQFCPGNSIYNNSYPEVGFCINDKLYAVYSSVATLVEVPPGSYGSISAGNSCGFTVGEHCQVTN